MKVSIDEKARTITITLPIEDPKPSSSGKTMVIASTNGNRATGQKVEYAGKPAEVVVGVNAYFKP